MKSGSPFKYNLKTCRYSLPTSPLPPPNKLQCNSGALKNYCKKTTQRTPHQNSELTVKENKKEEGESGHLSAYTSSTWSWLTQCWILIHAEATSVSAGFFESSRWVMLTAENESHCTHTHSAAIPGSKVCQWFSTAAFLPLKIRIRNNILTLNNIYTCLPTLIIKKEVMLSNISLDTTMKTWLRFRV